MTPTRLYLIRHGETEQNRSGVLMGSTDTPLNDQGRLQAASLRERINALEVDTIFSSPLSRAVETATLVFGEEVPIITDSSLQEFHFGEWEGMHFSEIAKQYPEVWKMWLTDWEQTHIPGGEAFAACEFIMDYLKTRAPFWKREATPDGARWVDARDSDNAAAERWKT